MFISGLGGRFMGCMRLSLRDILVLLLPCIRVIYLAQCAQHRTVIPTLLRECRHVITASVNSEAIGEPGTPHQSSPHMAGFDAVGITSDVSEKHRNCSRSRADFGGSRVRSRQEGEDSLKMSTNAFDAVNSGRRRCLPRYFKCRTARAPFFLLHVSRPLSV